MSPVLFILTIKEEYYPTLWKVVRIWSKVLIYGMGFRLNFKLEQEIEPNKSYMFCPNHGSLMDGFVLVVTSKNPIVFVGKTIGATGFSESSLYSKTYDRRFRPIGVNPRFPIKG